MRANKKIAELEKRLLDLKEGIEECEEDGDVWYDTFGFDVFGEHRDTGTEYDSEGYDTFGENEWGLNRTEMAEIEEYILERREGTPAKYQATA